MFFPLTHGVSPGSVPFPPRMPMPAVGLAPFFEASQRQIRATARFNAHIFKHANDLSSELLDFTDDCLDQDRETAQILTGCTTPQEFFAASRTFWDATLRQSAEEMMRLSALLMNQSFESYQDLQNQWHELALSVGSPLSPEINALRESELAEERMCEEEAQRGVPQTVQDNAKRAASSDETSKPKNDDKTAAMQTARRTAAANASRRSVASTRAPRKRSSKKAEQCNTNPS